MRVLHQFPISHFCEKSRWNLDAKGLPFRVRDVLPGLHKILLPRGAEGTVPVLEDEGFVVSDSTAIANYLDERYGAPFLVPRGPERDRALELDAYFGDVGAHIRRGAYGALLEEPGRAARALFGAYPLPHRIVGRIIGPAIERLLVRVYRIDRAGRDESREAIFAAMDRLERETGGDPDRYLIGDRLSIADITAAAVFAPIAQPPGTPWASGPTAAAVPETEELRAALAPRPGMAWVRARYARDRHVPLEA